MKNRFNVHNCTGEPAKRILDAYYDGVSKCSIKPKEYAGIYVPPIGSVDLTPKFIDSVLNINALEGLNNDNSN